MQSDVQGWDSQAEIYSITPLPKPDPSVWSQCNLPASMLACEKCLFPMKGQAPVFFYFLTTLERLLAIKAYLAFIKFEIALTPNIDLYEKVPNK